MNRLISYYRARYYSPQIGRFLSRDPLGSPLMMGRNAYRLSVITKSLWHLYFGLIDPSGNMISRLERLSSEPMRSAELKQGPNLYEYVWDNPTNNVDPSGLQALNPGGTISSGANTSTNNSVVSPACPCGQHPETVYNQDQFANTTSTAETRAHNYVNEITSITDTTGGTPTTTPK